MPSLLVLPLSYTPVVVSFLGEMSFVIWTQQLLISDSLRPTAAAMHKNLYCNKNHRACEMKKRVKKISPLVLIIIKVNYFFGGEKWHTFCCMFGWPTLGWPTLGTFPPVTHLPHIFQPTYVNIANY